MLDAVAITHASATLNPQVDKRNALLLESSAKVLQGISNVPQTLTSCPGPYRAAICSTIVRVRVSSYYKLPRMLCSSIRLSMHAIRPAWTTIEQLHLLNDSIFTTPHLRLDTNVFLLNFSVMGLCRKRLRCRADCHWRLQGSQIHVVVALGQTFGTPGDEPRGCVRSARPGKRD